MKKITNIENFRTDDQRKFWNVTRNLGQKRCSNDVILIKDDATSKHMVLKSSEVLAIWNQKLRSSVLSKYRTSSFLFH